MEQDFEKWFRTFCYSRSYNPKELCRQAFEAGQKLEREYCAETVMGNIPFMTASHFREFGFMLAESIRQRGV